MKSIIKRAIAVLLILTVALLTACSVTMDAVKAAEIGGSDVDLSSYGEYISNDELGELVSYGGYISKKEYSAMLSDGSVGASYNPSFAFCYDTNGYVITVRRAMIGQYVGESALMISVNSSRAYCIQPGAALNTGSSLTQTTSSGVWAGLSANQKEAVNTALCYGREGNFSNIKGNTSINSDECYIATQLIIWESTARKEFDRMIKDCKKGRIDIIFTKSISRFSRDTYDFLVTIRKLKEIGVDVYFQNEMISLNEQEGEFMMTVFEAAAQQESTLCI